MNLAAVAWLAWLGSLSSAVGAEWSTIPAKQDEAGEVEVVPVEEEGGEEPVGPVMSLEEEGPVTPAVREVAPPPPAREALSVPTALEVRLTARRIVAEQVRLVPLEIRTATDVRTLRMSASFGEVHGPDRKEAGLFEAYVSLPPLRGPAVLLVLVEGEGYAGSLRIAVWKAANLDISTEPGAQVRVEIAGQTFGPVRAAGRTATVPVEIPPGADKATVVARDAAGNETTRQIDLPNHPFPRALIVPPATTILADDEQTLPVLVVATDDWGGIPATFSLETDTGALGEPAEIQPGMRLYSWRPSRALGERGLTVRSEDGDTRQAVTMIAGPATGIEIQAAPNILPANGLSTATIYAGVSDGYGHYIESGAIEVEIAGGTTIQAPEQTGPVVLATVAADRMLPGAEPPAAIVVTARSAGYEGVVAIRQFDPEARGLRLTADPPRLPADGESRSTIRVELLDGLGDPLPVNGEVEISALGGTVPATVELVDGSGSFTFQASTQAGIISIRAAQEGATAHTTVTLDAGAPDHMRTEVVPDTAAGPGWYRVRARVEDRFGNGVGGSDLPEFHATASNGSLGPLAAVDAENADAVGWMEAELVLPPDEFRATEVEVTAGSWFGRARTSAPGVASLYIGAMSGYAHNLGDSGVIPARLSVGWIDAFGLRGFLFGAELGYLGLRVSTVDAAGERYDVAGDALTAYAIFGYRWAITDWLVLFGELGVGLAAAWFAVDGSETAVHAASTGRFAFSVGARLALGFVVGPGLITVELAYDDARFDDLVKGNYGGLGGLLGYRLEI
jgi:hypothetical protein